MVVVALLSVDLVESVELVSVELVVNCTQSLCVFTYLLNLYLWFKSQGQKTTYATHVPAATILCKTGSHDRHWGPGSDMRASRKSLRVTWLPASKGDVAPPTPGCCPPPNPVDEEETLYSSPTALGLHRYWSQFCSVYSNFSEGDTKSFHKLQNQKEENLWRTGPVAFRPLVIFWLTTFMLASTYSKWPVYQKTSGPKVC